MASDIRREIDKLKESIKEQGNTVRGLKKKKDPSVKSEVEKLKSLKNDLNKLLEELKLASVDPEEERRKVKRDRFDTHLIRRFFVVQTGEIYGGSAGLFDFGPPACAILRHMIDLWRKHFVFRERMLEIACPALTPEVILKTSGHVEKFTDLMVRDIVTKDCLRADKLLESFLEDKLKLPEVAADENLVREYKDAIGNADAYTPEELGDKFRKYQVITEAGNKVEGHDGIPLVDGGNPFPFNLMFGTDLGATGKSRAFLRPETAQGIFVNFGRLLEFNKGKLPFASAQIGSAYRNEIAPRAGLLRVREFMMAEIEHFVDPDNKNHPKFKTIKNIIVPLHSQHTQSELLEPLQISLEKAVDDGIVSSQTMAYFLGRTYLYLAKIGIKPEKLRFRQHKTNEMAHYAADCWDAEILTFYGWVECVGHADRSCYDLSRHAEMSKTNLHVEQALDKPIEVADVKKKIDKRAIGKALKKEGQTLMKYLNDMSVEQARKLRDDFESNNGIAKVDVNGKLYEVKSDWITLTDTTKKVNNRRFVPHVIEPSFGLGRILYCVLEHAYDDLAFENEEAKDDKKSGDVVRAVLRLPNIVAPYKAAVLSLSKDENIEEIVETLVDEMSENGLSVRDDTSGASIGRKYSRVDELGIPYAITVDFDSKTDSTVTIRDRDSTQQIRVKSNEVVSVIRRLVNGDLLWSNAYETYPKQMVAAN